MSYLFLEIVPRSKEYLPPLELSFVGLEIARAQPTTYFIPFSASQWLYQRYIVTRPTST